jgi:hypothetical protein
MHLSVKKLYPMRNFLCIALLGLAISIIVILSIVDDASLLYIPIPRMYNKTNEKIHFVLLMPNRSNHSKWFPSISKTEPSKLTSGGIKSSVQIISVILDFKLNVSESNMNEWLSLLAFAKMLQFEAKQRLGIETQIIWIGSIQWNSICFLKILKDIIFTTNISEFDVLYMKQEEWLGGKSKLFHVHSHNWLNALTLLKQLKKSKKAQYNNLISLPFMIIKDTPTVVEWTYLLELKPFLVADPSCCSLTLPKSNYLIIDLNKASLPSLETLSYAMKAIHGTDIILLDSSIHEVSKSFALGAEKKGYVLHSLDLKKSNYSDYFKYCLIQRKSLAFVGSLDSPVDIWAGFTKSKSNLVVLLSKDVSEVKKLRQIKFSNRDPRSNILFETFHKFDEKYHSLGSEQYPISLIVETSEQPEVNLAYGYAYQYLLRTSFKIWTNLVVLKMDDSRKKYQQRFRKCFVHPNLNSIFVSTKQYLKQLHDLKAVGLSSVFRVEDSFINSSNHIALLEILSNFSAIDIISKKFGDQNRKQQVITFPFIFFAKSAKVRADDGFRKEFDSIFDRIQSFDSCQEFISHDSLWMMVHNRQVPLSDEKLTKQVVIDTRESSALSQGQIVVQLSGEMANHLCKIAYGLGLKWILEEDYDTSTNILWRHQDSDTWRIARASVIMCFPNLRQLDFSQGNTQEFTTRMKQQDSIFGTNTFYIKKCEDEKCIRRKLEAFLNILKQKNRESYGIPNNANITLPFLYSDTLAMFGYINDRYYERFRFLFEFDLGNPSCCSMRAQRNENMIHARGFIQEMPTVGKRLDFEELSPNKTVNEILKHYHPGEKVAVLSRFPSFGEKYVQRMIEAKLDARLIETPNGMQSFCFLLSGKAEFIGYSKSTFAIWAAYLGNATRVRLYNLRSPERGPGMLWYNFTNAEIQKRFSFEDYNSEEQDKLDEEKFST